MDLVETLKIIFRPRNLPLIKLLILTKDGHVVVQFDVLKNHMACRCYDIPKAFVVMTMSSSSQYDI